KQAFGFGTYEWVMRTSSTSATPYGEGSAMSGQVSSGFAFIDASTTEIDFEIDGVLVSTHTEDIPQVPAYVMINHWGTNSTGWGGLATVGVSRYMYISSFTYTAASSTQS